MHKRYFKDKTAEKKQVREGLDDYYLNKTAAYQDNELLRLETEYGIASPITQAVIQLQDAGIPVLGEGYFSVSPAARPLLVAEAVNLAAKCIDPDFYDLKPYVFVAAAAEGHAKGVYIHSDTDEYNQSTYSLFHKNVGVVSFHDPNSEIESLLNNVTVSYAPPFPWSGVKRLDEAFELLGSAEAVQEMALKTKPRLQQKPEIPFDFRTRIKKEQHAERLRF